MLNYVKENPHSIYNYVGDVNMMPYYSKTNVYKRP